MKTNKSLPYVFIAPALILFALFTIYPIFSSFMLSFQTMDAGEYSFTGLSNYKRLLEDDIFWTALGNTGIILIIQVPVMILLALVLANALNSQLLKLRGLFRVSFFLPAVTSLVAYSILFSIILQDEGIMNTLLGFIGIDPIQWLGDPFWAKVSIIVAMTWRWTGYNMVIFLAALQSLSHEVYEAADLDGANRFQKFFHVTVPQLKPVILFATILSTIGTLQLFDEPFNLTKGGPADSTMTLGLYIYQNGFEYFDFGYASAVAYVVVLLVGVLTFFQFKFTGDK
ncbi:sugar ABC transporter permease [Priestia flexa]|uniref:carbohydrate ABC transporter permease n=1 Tax=Priestia flexa TaxID=86664 RepID=UPI00077C3CFB|nr:sugar ABC transporter permease [Priestia flexa]AQX55676.1 lactose ABC transporter permease [Priestia flexa]MBY6086095.1 sugar ABC transporter permease [Priestia flexa]MCG7313869.1 sugar ABC transporter permease [Priestia flexa]MCM3067979.1 sugar ABC transporter permease [Priestia flexa]MCP1188386.1 sugar ABC transporter permease [Priestia flexa]